MMARWKDGSGSDATSTCHPEGTGHREVLSYAKHSCLLPGSSSATERCKTCKIFMGTSVTCLVQSQSWKMSSAGGGQTRLYHCWRHHCPQ